MPDHEAPVQAELSQFFIFVLRGKVVFFASFWILVPIKEQTNLPFGQLNGAISPSTFISYADVFIQARHWKSIKSELWAVIVSSASLVSSDCIFFVLRII